MHGSEKKKEKRARTQIPYNTKCTMLIKTLYNKSNKNERGGCQDEDHNPFSVHILQLRVLEKVRSVFTGGGWSWIKSRATGVGRELVEGQIILTWQRSPLCGPLLTISGHLLFNFSLFPLTASYRTLFNMHTNAHARSHKGGHLL